MQAGDEDARHKTSRARYRTAMSPAAVEGCIEKGPTVFPLERGRRFVLGSGRNVLLVEYCEVMHRQENKGFGKVARFMQSIKWFAVSYFAGAHGEGSYGRRKE